MRLGHGGLSQARGRLDEGVRASRAKKIQRSIRRDPPHGHETQKGGLRARRTKLTNVDLLCRIGAASLNSGGVSVVC